MRLKDQKPSKNYVDKTSTLVLPDPPDMASNAYVNSHVHVPPRINIKDLTDHEKFLVDEYGFGPDDILLMRATKASPEDVIKGWGLGPQN